MKRNIVLEQAVSWHIAIGAVLICTLSFNIQAEELRTFSAGMPEVVEEVTTAVEGKTKAIHDLLQVYELAQNNDPEWASAQKANQAAQEKVIQGRALLLPTIGISANANRSNTDIEYTGANNVFRNDGKERFDTFAYTVNASQPLYRPKNNRQYQQSKIQVAYADVQLTSAEQDLIIRVSQAYFDVLTAQDKITLIDAQKEAVEQQLRQAEKNFKVGVAMITDVNDAKAQFDLLKAEEIAAQNKMESTKRALETMTGVMSSSLASLNKETKVETVVLAEVDTWIALALQNSPEYLAQQKAVEYANKNVDINQADHLPTLDAVGSYSYTDANGGINGFGNKLDNFTIGLQLQVPLYQGGAISSKKREAVINYEKALDDLEQIRRKVVLETRQAWLDVNTSVAEIIAYEQAVISGESQVESTKKSLQVGLRNTVDVLDAQQQLYASKHSLNVARYTYLTNLLKLKTAAGVITNQDVVTVNNVLEKNFI